MKITINAFSDYKKYIPEDAPLSGWVVEVDDGARIEELLERIEIPVSAAQVFTVNDTNEKADYVLKENDFLKIFPMAMGG